MSSTMNQNESLWLKLLTQSSTRTITPESTCIVLGDNGSGKRSLVSSLCKSDTSEHSLSWLEIATYNFFEVDDPAFQSPTKINLWAIDERLIKYTSDLLMGKDLQNIRVAFIIAVDLTKGEAALVSIKYWLLQIIHIVKNVLSTLNNEQSDYIKSQFAYYLDSARVHKGQFDQTSDSSNYNFSSSSYQAALTNFPFPIIITGCKMDLLDLNDISSIKLLKELQGKIRLLSLEIGASIIFTSTEDEKKISLLKRYISHRLYPEYLSMELNLEEKAELTFIPSGFDAQELISIVLGPKALENKENLQVIIQNGIEKYKPSETNESITQTNEITPTTDFFQLESEQEWLQGLHTFILQVGKDFKVSHANDNQNIEPDISTPVETEKKPKSLASSTTFSKSTSNLTSGMATRRASTRSSVTSAEPAGVEDFFKNLLEKGSNKK